MKKILSLMVLLLSLSANAQQVTLAWDESPSVGVVNYRVYWGTNSGSYQFSTNVGMAFTQTVNLPHRGRWFFAATAVDSYGIESDYSNEASWESKPKAPNMRGKKWVRITPIFGRSSNLVDWSETAGEASWFPATNSVELFRMNRIERVLVP